VYNINNICSLAASITHFDSNTIKGVTSRNSAQDSEASHEI